MIRVVVVVVVVSAFATSAAAQMGQVAAAVVPKPVVFDIDEDVIEASLARPTVTPVVVSPGKKPHRSLIRLRPDFRAQVLGSISAL